MLDRFTLIAKVLEEAAQIGRELTAGRSRPFGSHHLSRSQLEVLFVIAHAPEPISAGALAGALTVTPGAVTQLVAGLRELGLVEISTPGDDARVRAISLTADARAQVGTFEHDQVARLAPRFDGLRTSELRRLAELLAKRRG
ncbi:MarR family winged helix-turn-helix transcriptional regulator [Microbacterium telephonicum]|uniref:DNA-binding MarR family transcriptional regulator n=1 Tax=Microbacterium telephonicum TaxID=1714841 RepID=A0A498CDE7_9MICO|nr:MarR family transcriptional regulator [Microbacterium telephonicum]RLK52556.1 DNA-binding MarR family transcriptional regulator [Microbacterium telephonicum]